MGRKRVTSLAVAIHSSFLKDNKFERKRENGKTTVILSYTHQVMLPAVEAEFSTQGRTNEEKVSLNLYM
jgi:hypothetical protein